MRYLLFLLLPAFAAPAVGQIYIDSYRFGVATPAADSLLDLYPGAVGAYSLRLLDKDYTGNCIQVRRNNGDTSNIGFASGYLDTSAVKTFCGTGATDTCRVRRWYDQSGNGNNLDSVSNIAVPLIVINGSIPYVNGLPSIDFIQFASGAVTNTELRTGTFTGINLNDGLSIFGVLKHERQATEYPYSVTRGGTSANYVTGPYRNATNQNRSDFRWTTLVQPVISQNIVGVQILDNSFVEFVSTGNGNFKRAINNGSLTNNSVTWTSDVPNMIIAGQYRPSSPGFYYGGKLQELIVYPSDKQADRTNISNNINSYYSIW